MNTNKQLILLKKNSFFYLFLKNMIPTLSLISIFSPFISILTGFLGLNTREQQGYVFRSGSISVDPLTEINQAQVESCTHSM